MTSDGYGAVARLEQRVKDGKMANGWDRAKLFWWALGVVCTLMVTAAVGAWRGRGLFDRAGVIEQRIETHEVRNDTAFSNVRMDISALRNSYFVLQAGQTEALRRQNLMVCMLEDIAAGRAIRPTCGLSGSSRP